MRGRTVTISFSSTGPATSFRCQLRLGHHKAAFRRCSSPQTYKHLKRGTYTFSVTASAPGEVFKAPARRTFTVR